MTRVVYSGTCGSMRVQQSIAEKAFYDPAIDGLRGIAILSVILNHSMYCASQDPIRVFHFPFLLKISKGGAGGVSLFFVLSALTLMTSTHFRFGQEQFPKIAFYVRRSFRILPLWWFFIFISAIVRKPARAEILPHLFMYFGFMPNMNFTHVGWSLFVEETFYLIFPLIFVWLLTLRGAVLFLIITLSLSGRIFSWNLIDSLPSFLPIPQFPLPFHYSTFALGVMAFHIVKMRLIVVADTKLHSFLGSKNDSNSSFGTPFFTARTTAYFQWASSIVSQWILDLIAAVAFGVNFLADSHGNVQIIACFVLVVIAMTEGTITRKLLSTKVLGLFGVCCYSIYLFHGLFLFSIRYASWFLVIGKYPLGPDLQLIVAFVLGASVSLLFGMFLFKHLEQPCVRLGKSVVQKLGLGRI